MKSLLKIKLFFIFLSLVYSQCSENKECFHGGNFNTQTCECECYRGYSGDFCEKVNCNDQSDMCGSSLTPDMCVVDEISSFCPLMCGSIACKCGFDRCLNEGIFNQESCSCTCPLEFDGPLCEKRKTCEVSSCKNEGHVRLDTCECECFKNYDGKECENLLCDIPDPDDCISYTKDYCVVQALNSYCPHLCSKCSSDPISNSTNIGSTFSSFSSDSNLSTLFSSLSPLASSFTSNFGSTREGSFASDSVTSSQNDKTSAGVLLTSFPIYSDGSSISSKYTSSVTESISSSHGPGQTETLPDGITEYSSSAIDLSTTKDFSGASDPTYFSSTNNNFEISTNIETINSDRTTDSEGQTKITQESLTTNELKNTEVSDGSTINSKITESFTTENLISKNTDSMSSEIIVSTLLSDSLSTFQTSLSETDKQTTNFLATTELNSNDQNTGDAEFTDLATSSDSSFSNAPTKMSTNLLTVEFTSKNSDLTTGDSRVTDNDVTTVGEIETTSSLGTETSFQTSSKITEVQSDTTKLISLTTEGIKVTDFSITETNSYASGSPSEGQNSFTTGFSSENSNFTTEVTTKGVSDPIDETTLNGVTGSKLPESSSQSTVSEKSTGEILDSSDFYFSDEQLLTTLSGSTLTGSSGHSEDSSGLFTSFENDLSTARFGSVATDSSFTKSSSEISNLATDASKITENYTNLPNENTKVTESLITGAESENSDKTSSLATSNNFSNSGTTNSELGDISTSNKIDYLSTDAATEDFTESQKDQTTISSSISTGSSCIKDLECKNLGFFNKETCKCQCLQSYAGEFCEKFVCVEDNPLVCKDKSFCNQPGLQDLYTAFCPKLCGLCN
ncbi:unnamed protein product [Brachionus calyciflorus]|uniref:EGF-like domain-containing protein n=1 Tax=Brachionus calyciflorus TaxID=104777 RepID=A0A814A4U0_9BILA|nr:unnamed protein product [Brachionus calyciflorus]